MLLGLFITTIHMPGIPKLTWGEEQAFYVLDSTASNYIYGRQAMSPSMAWQVHGCYALGSTQYYQMPWDAARHGCTDDGVSLDHRDPSHPVRNIIKHMYHLRQEYPVLNDGWYLQQLSNQTHKIQYPGSGNTTTETGIWSVLRSEFQGAQSLANSGGQGNQTIWLVYHNVNDTTTYTFNCSDPQTALLSAFSEGMTVKNLFYPHDELELKSSTSNVGYTGPGDHNGCVDSLTMKGYEFKAYVPKEMFVAPPPMITRFSPGHDARIKSQVPAGEQETVQIEIQFSTAMDCDAVTSSVQINSTTEDLRIAEVQKDSVQCSAINAETPQHVAGIPSTWSWKATLDNVSNGVHTITLLNATTVGGNASTNSVDRFMFRTGQDDNPMVFPQKANYTRALLHEDATNGSLYISHKAAGADKWRYSLNWGTSFSDWQDYHGGNNTLKEQPWTGTSRQKWQDTHIIAQYWSRLAGSSAVVQHADLKKQDVPRRFPHFFAHGKFTYDSFATSSPSRFSRISPIGPMTNALFAAHADIK
jgi:alpha-1,3-glucan synthase